MPKSPVSYLPFILVPVSVVLYLLHQNPVIIFAVTVLAVFPLTGVIARATEQLSMRSGTVMGSLFNATFGNAIELMIAVLALRSGLVELVKASIAGSIILNLLLLIGLSMIFGGARYKQQTFNKDSIGVASTMLLIAIAGLSLPTIYSVITGKPVLVMSRAVSVTLGITYLFSLLFVLKTHRHLFIARRDTTERVTWGRGKAVLALLLATAAAGYESHILVEVIEPTLLSTQLSETFIGLVLVAIITNVPEHMAAIRYGMRDNITLSMEIGMNSAIQIALFVVPILVLASPLFGSEMTLTFEPLQMVAMILTVMIINYLGSDGICNWLEGVQLVAVYTIIAIAFYFI